MRKIIGAAVTLAVVGGVAYAPFAHAQVSIDPSKPQSIAGILTWKDEEQAKGYRDIEHVYKTTVIHRGKSVHPLPVAARQLDPTFSYDGKTWTVDEYMKAYRVSGVLVLKDGKIVLEKYALGRKPTTAGPPSRSPSR